MSHRSGKMPRETHTWHIRRCSRNKVRDQFVHRTNVHLYTRILWKIDPPRNVFPCSHYMRPVSDYDCLCFMKIFNDMRDLSSLSAFAHNYGTRVATRVIKKVSVK